MKKVFVVVLCCFAVVWSVFPAGYAHAQTQLPLSLTVSPLPISLTTAPGASVSTPIRIKNDTSQDEHLRVGVLTFSAAGETGFPELKDPTPTDTFIDWISFSETEFTVPAGQWYTITATISPPEDASFGYYYAVTFSRTDATVIQDSNTAVVGATAVLVLLNVDVPNAIRAAEVQEFSIDKPWYEFLPVAFTVRVRNMGNVHIAPRGNIFISKAGEKDIAILEVNRQQGNILPDSVRAFTAQWADGFPVYTPKIENNKIVQDENGPTQELSWDFTGIDKLRFGKYNAKMLLVYDDGKRDIPVEGELSFWVVPWRIGLGVLGVALFAMIGIYATVIRPTIRALRRTRRRTA